MNFPKWLLRTEFVVLAVLGAALSVMASGNVSRRFIWRAREVVLMQDLVVMRVGIDTYTRDRQQAPQSLQDLVSGGYLREIPCDPLTHKKDWVLHFDDVVLSKKRHTFGVDNVHSNSDHNGW